MFGLRRYLLLAQAEKGSGNPTRVLLGRDVSFALNTLAWMATAAWVILRHP